MTGADHIEQGITPRNTESKLLQSIWDFVFGKTEAFEHIYNSTCASLMAVCRRYAASEDEAKDILQETYIKIYKNLNKFDTSQPFESWSKRIAINTAIDHYRKTISKSLRSLGDMDIVDEEDVFVPNKVLEYDIEKVLEAIRQLPDGYRVILNLYVFEHKSHREISELLNITESSSRSQLTKARKTLKAKFE